MTTTEPATPVAPTGEQFGVLTDAAIERSRKRLGIPQPQHNPPHNFEVSIDGSRHFAYGFGDDNPLYCDPDYAAAGDASGEADERAVGKARRAVEKAIRDLSPRGGGDDWD